eukprot:CAMPEP_0201606540 /NCGR_PEP_ID=MMETSP0492-20130828/5960_1 /ASSEMBLY_ACC=CAM_ASM_000837 /TAXON_ID=420259 /ORGANISM="Thalassiosira gravida, Strain GMp14c1" /LENGTH=39 /DNA_ID= /DNA_START= /DNA_END= /DNA_ORIENTATION=
MTNEKRKMSENVDNSGGAAATTPHAQPPAKLRYQRGNTV